MLERRKLVLTKLYILFSHLQGVVGNGLRGTSNIKSFTAPVNSILAICGLAVLDVHTIGTRNLGGYVPILSISFRSS